MTVVMRLKKKFRNLFLTFVLLTSVFITFYFINIRFAITHGRKYHRNLNQTKTLTNSEKPIKYLLLWTSPYTSPFLYFGTKNSVFIKKKCKWNNCYVTSDRKYLGDYTEFDVVAFNGPELLEHLTFGDIPVRRSKRQKYVFANIEASSNYPMCTHVWNGFFNWTWTYKLNSDAVWSYIAIRNSSNHVIGPNKNMNWLRLDEMDDIDDNLKNELKSKSKPAAWFSSNCLTQSLRESYVEELRHHLQKFSMDINIYGKCGEFGCPREIMPQCLKRLKKHYYFYLAFENAISEDYVTEKILSALNYNTVPIVFGGANYTRCVQHTAYKFSITWNNFTTISLKNTLLNKNCINVFCLKLSIQFNFFIAYS